MVKLPKIVTKMINKGKKQHTVVRAILVIGGLYLIYNLFTRMRWIVGNNSYLEGFMDKTFVFFKMNGCPHCVKMEPEWAKFEKNNKSGIKTKTMEASSNKKEAKEWGVSGYPTLLLVSGGKVIDTFNGERNSEGFSEFAEKHK